MTHKLICTACGSYGSPKQKDRGGFGFELILWFLVAGAFLGWLLGLPGIVLIGLFIIAGAFSAWRATGSIKVCGACGNPSLIPTDSPVAKKIIEEHNIRIDEIDESIGPRAFSSKGVLIVLSAITLLIVFFVAWVR
ncbi:MAG: hypothetical protein V1711_02780 [bacterium]